MGKEEFQQAKTNFFSSQENVHIGTQGENYARSLFGLMRHPNGDRRPDLVSVNGSYTPKLSMEVKSSRTGRGVIAPPALTYGFTSNLDYVSIFGAALPTEDTEELVKDIEYNRFREISPSVLYYNLLSRTDNLSGKDFKNKYSDLGIEFGDQILIPHELVFYSYIIGKMTGHKTSFEGAFNSTKQIVTSFIMEGYNYNNPESNDCQPVRFNDYLSLFFNDPSILVSDQAKERVRLLGEHYGEDRLSGLEKITYLGPNGTHIHALYKPEHADLFINQLKERVGQRRGIMTRLSQSRLKEFQKLIGGYVLEEELFKNGNVPVLNKTQVLHLERLLSWKREDDKGPEFSGEHPSKVEKIQESTDLSLF